MSMRELLIIYAVILATMLASRLVPFFALKGRALPDNVSEAIGLIPTAAFTALVANDLFDPELFTTNLVDGLLTLAVAGAVVVVARRTKSLIWCAVIGMLGYAVVVLRLTF